MKRIFILLLLLFFVSKLQAQVGAPSGIEWDGALSYSSGPPFTGAQYWVGFQKVPPGTPFIQWRLLRLPLQLERQYNGGFIFYPISEGARALIEQMIANGDDAGFSKVVDFTQNGLEAFDDVDNDGIADALDDDIDGDGVQNIDDADPFDPNVTIPPPDTGELIIEGGQGTGGKVDVPDPLDTDGDGIVDNQGLIDRAEAHNKAIDDMTFIDSFSVDGTDEEIAVFDFALPGGQTKSLTLSTKVDTSTPYGQAFEKGRLILRAFFALILTLAFVSQIYKTLRQY